VRRVVHAAKPQSRLATMNLRTLMTRVPGRP
jgi:hypothetical protein